MKLTLETPIDKLRMVGPAYTRRLKKLEIETIQDLLFHAPHRYQDYSQISSISAIRPEETVTIQGTVVECKNLYTRSRKVIQKATVQDKTGQIKATWFNQPFIPNTIKKGTTVNLSGKVKGTKYNLELTSPEYEIIKADKSKTIHTGRLVPVYPETEGISSKWLRSRISPLLKIFLPQLDDWLPPTIIKKEKLLTLKQALANTHFPENLSLIKKSRERLAFDEMLLIQLSAQLKKQAWQQKKLAQKIILNNKKINQFISDLPFKLTKSQQISVNEILHDLNQKVAMNRLLLGDVGSGKTVVAAIAIYAAHISGQKSALMAPTEILALQHQTTLKSLLTPYGIKIAICTSSKKKNLNNFHTIIGTHALLYKTVEPGNLGIVIIDEQHRFGVEQRAKLIRKGIAPHTLTMTATPIPRTIALTLYGDLDLSIIDELPPGRKQIKTWLVPPKKRKNVYDWIKKRIKKGEQAFIVCPLIESSQHESMQQVKAATVEFENLQKNIFPELKLDILHGRLPAKKKEAIINKFRNHKTDILVSTPVVEVGIDISKATIMMIEGAERFGLAQLHQLRGRVGRGAKQSYCLLFTSSYSSNSSRLKVLEKSMSGSQLAQFDLKLRGPGEIFGTRQHGFHNLKFASFTDKSLVTKTQNYANKIIKSKQNMLKYPKLMKKLHTLEKAVEPN